MRKYGCTITRHFKKKSHLEGIQRAGTFRKAHYFCRVISIGRSGKTKNYGAILTSLSSAEMITTGSCWYHVIRQRIFYLHFLIFQMFFSVRPSGISQFPAHFRVQGRLSGTEFCLFFLTCVEGLQNGCVGAYSVYPMVKVRKCFHGSNVVLLRLLFRAKIIDHGVLSVL